MKYIACFVFLLFVAPRQLGAQCCAAGSPIGGFANQGVMMKKNLRTIAFYRHSLSEGYYEGDQEANIPAEHQAYYDFIGLNLAYGILPKLTLEAELGYFIDKALVISKEPRVDFIGRGLTASVFSLKTPVFNKNEWEWTLGAGARIPLTTEPQLQDQIELPKDVQASTGAYSIVVQSFLYRGWLDKHLRIFLLNRFEHNFPNVKDHYQYGKSFMSSVFASYTLGTHWVFVGQVRHEWRDQDFYDFNQPDGFEVRASGGHLVYFSPQVLYSLGQKLTVGLMGDIPLYRYYNSTQVASRYSFAITLMRTWQL
jgi:hypothetical protein